MIKTLTRTSTLLTFGVPLLLLLSLIFLLQSTTFSQHSSSLSNAIVLDLVFTIPVVYFLLVRKKSISNLSVVPVFIIGLVVATLLLPTEEQALLRQIKIWVVPVVELSVLTIIVLKVRKAINLYKVTSQGIADVFTAIKTTTSELIPNKLSIFAATEIAVLYYTFIAWKKRPLRSNEFTYHKKSGMLPLLAILVAIILIETAAIHLLVAQWNEVAAWVLSVLSIYTGFQVLGMTRAMTKRRITLGKEEVFLPYGLFNETTITYDNIVSIEIPKKRVKLEGNFRQLSPFPDFEKPNVIIDLKSEGHTNGLYGSKKVYKKLAIYVDDKERFVEELQTKQSSATE